MTNEEIDNALASFRKAVNADSNDYRQLVWIQGMEMLGEIAKRLGGSTVPVWTGPEGKPVPIGAQYEGDTIKFMIPRTENEVIRFSDMERILKMFGYTFESYLENQNTVGLIIKKARH